VIETSGQSRALDERMRSDFALIAGLRGFLELDAYFLLSVLRELAFQPGVPVLEVGVFCGRSLAAIATLYNDVPVHGVDPFFADFESSPAFADEADILSAKADRQTPEERIAALRDTLAGLDRKNGTALAKNVVLHRMTEAEFLSKNRERFQLIHIDAEHTFAAVKASLDRLPETLAPKGWFVIDDFLNPGFPDISEAVHTHPLFRRGLWPVVYGANKAVFLRAEAEAGPVAELRKKMAARFGAAGAVVRIMHDGAPMVEMAGFGQPVKRKKTLGARLRRLVGLRDTAAETRR
jgi:hypothetical protein